AEKKEPEKTPDQGTKSSAASPAPSTEHVHQSETVHAQHSAPSAMPSYTPAPGAHTAPVSEYAQPPTHGAQPQAEISAVTQHPLHAQHDAAFVSSDDKEPAPLNYHSAFDKRVDTQLQRMNELVDEDDSDQSHVSEDSISASTVPETNQIVSDYLAELAESLRQPEVEEQVSPQQAQTVQAPTQLARPKAKTAQPKAQTAQPKAPPKAQTAQPKAPPKAQTAQPKAQTVHQQTQTDQEYQQRPLAQSAADIYTLARQGATDALRDSLGAQAKGMDDQFGHFRYSKSK
uniref:hypothetical protein n=1 Tax=Endozoicomonas sp. ONNA2 TaxID=2828741 RepID=UPI002148B41D